MPKQQLFHLIYFLQQQRNKMVYMPLLMYIANFIIHLIIYLSLPSSGLIQLGTYLNNPNIIIIFSTYIAIIFLQFIVYTINKWTFKLVPQIYIYRFVVSPLFSMQVLSAANSGAIPVSLGILVFLADRGLSSVVIRAFLFESNRNYTLNTTETSIIQQFMDYQMFLISCYFLTIQNNQLIIALILLAISLNSYYKHFSVLAGQSNQFKILNMINKFHIAFSFFLCGNLLYSHSELKYYLMLAIPLVAYQFYIIYLKKSTAKPIFRRLLSIDNDFHTFLETADIFLAELKSIPSQNKKKLKKYLVSIIYEHKEVCDMPNCQLMDSNTEQELKSMNSRSINNLVHKILKKIQWIFQSYHTRYLDDINISFFFLKFYANFLHNRIKMEGILNHLTHLPLNFPQQYEYFKLKEICSDIENVQNIDAIKDQEIYVEFRNFYCYQEKVMISTMNFMIEFWSQFSEEKVDLCKVMQIAVKLFPFKAKVQEIFQDQIGIEKFTTFKILRLYGLYQKNILNQSDIAIKIEDYIWVLSQRLKDKQEIQYLSKESEHGFIVICLSANKLGNIFMVNEKACNIFKITKKQFLSKRVNQIMPSVIADMHDAILTDFLKKKRRKFNTDQRLLFGRDGNGYLFPVQLQLQKASFSSNDEYIFIASVRPQKLKSAPIYCIIDDEGVIKEFTASFKNIFFRSANKSYNRNIQQIIPGYFDVPYDEQTEGVRYFQCTIKNKKLSTQVHFQIAPIIVKGVKISFLVKMYYANDKTTETYNKLCLTNNLNELLKKQDIKGCQNVYNEVMGSYQIQSCQPYILKYDTEVGQFTLPFLKYQDMAYFMDRQVGKTYGNDIKTIRLVNSHYERLEQEDSFHSEHNIFLEKDNIKSKIQQIRQTQTRNQSRAGIYIFKVIMCLIILSAIANLLYLYSIFQVEVIQQANYLLSFDFQKQVLYQLPQYIISFSFVQILFNTQFFNMRMHTIQSSLISNIINANIPQLQKEQMIKIIYLQSPSQLNSLLDINIFNFTSESDLSIYNNLIVFWCTLLFLNVMLGVVSGITIYNFKQMLMSIYTIFLRLKESSIRKIFSSCKNLLEKIYFQSQENVEKDEQMKKDEEMHNQLQKIKQFKNTSRDQDFITFLKMVIPLFLKSIFIIILLVKSLNDFTNYQAIKLNHSNMFQTISSASIQFMKRILTNIDGISINVDSEFSFYYQQLEKSIIDFNNQSGNNNNFIQLLYGNICATSSAITPQMMNSCLLLGNGILITGISSSINFISAALNNIVISNTSTSLQTIYQLQFLFLNPTLLSIQDAMENILNQTISSISQFYCSMIIIIICFFAIYFFYLVVYILNSLETQILFTNQMISLMPENTSQDAKSDPKDHSQ